MWHPLRILQVVAIDVLEISTKSGTNCGKAAVMGDSFTRFVFATKIPNETAVSLANVIMDEWALLFGTPENLLSGQLFYWRSRQEFVWYCRIKYFKHISPSDRRILERFNGMQMKYICAHVSMNGADWEVHWRQRVFDTTQITRQRNESLRGSFRNRRI